jgi:hypothetical protein
MQLDFSSDELTTLKVALDRRVTELLDEIVHTDDREYGEGLKRDADRLDGVRKRVERALRTASVEESWRLG